jgi:hypothetical protein
MRRNEQRMSVIRDDLSMIQGRMAGKQSFSGSKKQVPSSRNYPEAEGSYTIRRSKPSSLSRRYSQFTQGNWEPEEYGDFEDDEDTVGEMDEGL